MAPSSGAMASSVCSFHRNLALNINFASARASRLRPFVPFFLASFTLAPMASALAQSAVLPVTPGTRVRVHAANLVTPLIAHYLEMRGDTAVFIEDASGRGIWSIPVPDISQLERSAGDKRQNGPYMTKGAIIGAPIGAVIAYIFAETVQPSDSTKKYNRLPTTAVGALVGAGVGALIGTRFASEHWSNVPLPRRVSVVPLRRGGVEVGLGFRF
jgi:hypothetical protein